MSPLRKTKDSTRIDLRIPDTLLDKIRELAIENNAPIHHISNKPELTGTIIDLLEKALSGNTSDSLSDNYHDGTIESLKGEFETAIAELETKFSNQLGEFKSLVFDDVITMGVMDRAIETAIDNRLKTFQLGAVSRLKQETIEAITQPIESIETATDTAIAVLPIDKNIQSRFPITSDELLKVTELLDSHNVPKTNKTKNQDRTPITDTESLQSRFDAGEWLLAKDYADLLGLTKNALDKRRSDETLPKDIETKKEGRFRVYRKVKTAIAE
jgi:hypothetical protein